MQPLLQSLPLAIACVVLVAVVSACARSGEATWLTGQPSPNLNEGITLTGLDRRDCGAIGSSDLRSPQEGVWFQTHCLPASQFPQGVASTNCNRLALSLGEFRMVAPGLYVFRREASSLAFLWYASTPECFDLVSERVVTAVCADRAVSFKWDLSTACAGHGGVLAQVNGH